MTDNGDPDNVLFTLLHSSGIPEQNHSRYRSKEYDELVEKAQRETELPRREELYRLAQDRLRADTPVVPLAYMPNFAGTSAKLTGFELHPVTLRLKNARLEK
jgi:peptide/nickel transport system substrate-binding protein